MIVTLNEFISEIRGDRIVRGSLATGLVLLVISSVAFWQQTIVDARIQAVSLHLGLNIDAAASQVDVYLNRLQQPLDDIADQTSTQALFANGDPSAMIQEEIDTAALIPDAESIRYIDSGLVRHEDSLDVAAAQMVQRSLAGDRVNPIAMKVDGHWKILLIKTVLSPEIPASSKAVAVGVIIMQMPIEGLSLALGTVDVANGTLQLQQTEPNRNDIIVLSLGDLASPFTVLPIQADHIRMLDTVNPRWKVSFIPSAKLLNAIEDQLPPFWLFFSIAWASLVPILYLITRYRISRRSWITDIFIEEHNAQDALFASPDEDEIGLPPLEMQASEPAAAESLAASDATKWRASEPTFDETPAETPEVEETPVIEEPVEIEETLDIDQPSKSGGPLNSKKIVLDAPGTEDANETGPGLEKSLNLQETPDIEVPLDSGKVTPAASEAEDKQDTDESMPEAEEPLDSETIAPETPEAGEILGIAETLAAAASSEAEAAELEEEITPSEYVEVPTSGPFQVPDVVFRDYDIRGIAGTEITKAFAERLGKTIGSIILQNGHTSIYIGRDGRISSPGLAASLRSGLLSTGCNVIDLGEIITPALNFAVHHCGQSSCGIMVTASHNPAIYNGFKIIIQRQTISGKALQLLKPMINAKTFTQSDSAQLFSRDIVSQYVRHIVEDSGIDRSFRLAIDAGNSVAGPVAIKLFESLGCTVFPINCEVDGTFPNHEPNPSNEKNLKQLISKVKEVKADMGLAFDGDGDRLVVISGKGEIIWPDRLMMIFARDILSRSPGAGIVFDVKSSKRLAQMIGKNSGRPIMCKTGHSHVRKAVQHNNAPLGGEFSGHIFFNDRWKGFDDGLYAASRLLEVLCLQRDRADKTLDQIINKFDTSSYSPEILIPVAEDEKFELMQALLSGCQFSGAQIISVDGLRVEYRKGWGLIRASNTSANLTLRFEGDDDASLEQVKKTFRRELLPFINQIEDYI